MAKESDAEIEAICSDISSRQKFRRGPQAVGDVLSRLMARRGYARVQSASGCAAAWRQAAGGELAQHSRPGNTRRGVLEVTVANSAALQELTFKKHRLLKQLKELVPDQKIRDLRFRIGRIEG